jgi:fructoselysine and glucoselysine-specific PTS system IIA component
VEKSQSTRKFLVATHGTFAAGIKSSLDIIIGAMDNVFLIQAYVDENKSIEAEINDIMVQVGDNDELVVFADILGGSVTNMLLQHALRPNVHIVSGFNLPLVIEILMADAGEPIEEVIASAIENAKEQMVYVNKLISTQTGDDND